MKLELKHLAPYLPYQVKCLVTNDGEEQIDILGALYDNGECTFYNIVEATQGFESIKPILRPISDLANEITFGSDVFNPMSKIFRNHVYDCPDELEVFYVQSVNKYVLRHGRAYFYYDVQRKTFMGEIVDNLNQYDMIQQLFEWHFDVFGLIEKGLAIDINTIEPKL